MPFQHNKSDDDNEESSDDDNSRKGTHFYVYSDEQPHAYAKMKGGGPVRNFIKSAASPYDNKSDFIAEPYWAIGRLVEDQTAFPLVWYAHPTDAELVAYAKETDTGELDTTGDTTSVTIEVDDDALPEAEKFDELDDSALDD